MATQRWFLILSAALVSLIGLAPLAAVWAQERQPSGRHRGIDAPRLVLQDLLAQAQLANPEIQAARARVEGARARIPQARALPDPMFSVGYTNEGFRRLTLGSAEETSLGFGLSQELPFPPKLALTGKVAEQERQREAELLRAAELEVISRLKVLLRPILRRALARDRREEQDPAGTDRPNRRVPLRRRAGRPARCPARTRRSPSCCSGWPSSSSSRAA